MDITWHILTIEKLLLNFKNYDVYLKTWTKAFETAVEELI